MSDEGESWLFDAAGEQSETLEAFKAKVERATDAQVKYRDWNGQTVLMKVAENHDWPELAAALIERGCDVNAKEEGAGNGNTALHYAGDRNRRETVRVLLEHGADPTIKNDDGDTAADITRLDNKKLAAYIDGAPALRAARGARPLRPPPRRPLSPQPPVPRAGFIPSSSDDSA